MRAAIFDMDGLLIDSEPLWRRAEIEVFGGVGVTLTEDDCRHTMGMRLDEVVRYWQQTRPWHGPSVTEVEGLILDRMETLIARDGEAMRGVHHALNLCRAKGMKIGLASSSPPRLIEAVLDRLELRHRFDAWCSAADEKRGKPHPAVFLTAAKRLDTAPEKCVAFEDSFHGIAAALAANMTVVAVPEPQRNHLQAFASAHHVLNHLGELREHMI